MEYQSRRFGLFRLDVGCSDHFTPLLRFVGDELAEVGRRAGEPGTGQLSEPRLHLRIGKPRIDAAAQPGAIRKIAPIVIASQIVLGLQMIESRQVDVTYQPWYLRSASSMPVIVPISPTRLNWKARCAPSSLGRPLGENRTCFAHAEPFQA